MHRPGDLTPEVETLCPEGPFDSAQFLAQHAFAPFAEEGLAFIADLSAEVLKDPEARRHPEVVALGFWMRRANIAKIKASFEAVHSARLFLGRGLVFHIAPSNVDTMFIYSLVLSILAGNTNIVRVSTKRNEQLACVLRLLAIVLGRNAIMSKRILVVRYEHNDSATAFFSGLCNVRMIWGGDATVSLIRAIPLPPHALELAFSGKFSVAVVDARTWNAEPRKAEVARAFCNDAFSFNQQGCSSPKLVYWRGMPDETEKARDTFWPEVEQAVAAMPFHALEPPDVLNRFVAVCAIGMDAGALISKHEAANNAFVRITVPCLEDVMRGNNTGNGLFYEYADKELHNLLSWFGNSDQTAASYGISKSEWSACLMNSRPKGICRIVPFGKALDFSPVWDGYDLVRFTCREITVDVRDKEEGENDA